MVTEVGALCGLHKQKFIDCSIRDISVKPSSTTSALTFNELPKIMTITSVLYNQMTYTLCDLLCNCLSFNVLDLSGTIWSSLEFSLLYKGHHNTDR